MGVFKNGYNHSSLFSSEPSIAAGRRSTCKNFQIREQASASSCWPNAYAPSRRRNHQFVSAAPWGTASLEQVLFRTADALVGGKDAVLIVDDTTLPRHDKRSVGARCQHCGVLDKQANCQVLVSLTLEQREVPAPITLALYLSKDWAQGKARRAHAKGARVSHLRGQGRHCTGVD
jgi:SRSO17 transposase